MDFSTALLAIKAGKAVSRPCLDGFISMTRGTSVSSDKIWSPHNRAFAEQFEQTTGNQVFVHPSITRCQPNNPAMIVMGWTPTQEDLFADDWQVCL